MKTSYARAFSLVLAVSLLLSARTSGQELRGLGEKHDPLQGFRWPPGKLVSISVTPVVIAFSDPSQRQQLRVIGAFSGGGLFDLTSSRFGTTYESANIEIVSASSEGLRG